MTTEIPKPIITPDKIKTRISTSNCFEDSFVKLAVAICLLVVLMLCAPGLGQSETGESNTAEVTEGILPVPDYSGDWKTRRFLTGDWGGLRQDWASKGITFDVEWLQIPQGIVSGGRDQLWAYATNLDYYINLDLMRMEVLPGALISFRGQSRFGSTVNEETGLLLPVNTFSALPVTSPPRRRRDLRCHRAELAAVLLGRAWPAAREDHDAFQLKRILGR